MLQQIVRRCIAPIAPLLPLSWLQSWSRQHHLSVFYHTVSDTSLPHIRHLYHVRDTTTFRTDLDYLLRFYTPVDAVTWLAHHQEGKPLPSRALLLTFDDGLSECYHTIAPILEEKGIPAVFFVNSDFVDNRALMFRYQVSLLIEQLQDASTPLLQAVRNCWSQHGLDFASPKQSLLQLRWQEQAVLGPTAQLCGVSFETFLREQQPYMTSVQLQELLDRGFDLGSHSCNHPRYQYLPLDQQIQQTIDSQQWLDNHFSIPHRLFAFPFTDFGVSTAFFERILEQEAFDMTFGGAGLKKERISRQVQRWGVETPYNTPLPRLLHTEYCYYLLKALVGKHTIYRT